MFLGLLLWIENFLLAFSGSDQYDDQDKPVLVIEPQAISLANRKREHQREEFASNAGSPDVKLKTGFSFNCKYFNGGKYFFIFQGGRVALTHDESFGDGQ